MKTFKAMKKIISKKRKNKVKQYKIKKRKILELK
jgi:hypothetical protein